MTKRGVWLLLVAVAVATVSGQRVDDVFPFSVSVFELDNGLKVVNVEVDSPGIVAYYTIIRTGSRNEVEPGFSGYAHFFEHMMFRGTEKYPTEAYNAVIKQMGADSNAFTTDDWTAYHIVASSDALETIIDIESDRFSISGTRRTISRPRPARSWVSTTLTFPIRSPSCGRSCSIGPLSSTRTSTRRSVS